MYSATIDLVAECQKWLRNVAYVKTDGQTDGQTNLIVGLVTRNPPNKMENFSHAVVMGHIICSGELNYNSHFIFIFILLFPPCIYARYIMRNDIGVIQDVPCG